MTTIGSTNARQASLMCGAAAFAIAGTIGVAMIASPREWLVFRIHSTRTITSHLSLGYDRRSLEALTTRLSPGDVPLLIDLLVASESPLDATMALESQCQASVGGLAKAFDSGKIGRGPGAMSDLFRARDVASILAGSSFCSSSARASAKELSARLATAVDELVPAPRVVGHAAFDGARRSLVPAVRDRLKDPDVPRGLDELSAYANGTLPSTPRPTGSSYGSHSQ